MQLIGMFDSPFVRRVAVSMMILGVPFEHVNRSVGKDFEWIRRYNPLGRAPTLITDDGEFLIESGAILDFVDELVGPQRALLPAFAEARRHALRLMAIATGSSGEGHPANLRAGFQACGKAPRALACALPHSDAFGPGGA
jgi:glutathione S-transferase